jgi:hypothetical protein
MSRFAPVVLVLALASSGCSLLFMEKPPPGNGPVPRGNCTRSIVAPVLDVVDGLGPLVWTLGAAETDGLDDDTVAGVRVVAAASLALHTYSAIRGFGWSSECKERNALSEQAMADYLRTISVTDPSDR